MRLLVLLLATILTSCGSTGAPAGRGHQPPDPLHRQQPHLRERSAVARAEPGPERSRSRGDRGVGRLPRTTAWWITGTGATPSAPSPTARGTTSCCSRAVGAAREPGAPGRVRGKFAEEIRRGRRPAGHLHGVAGARSRGQLGRRDARRTPRPHRGRRRTAPRAARPSAPPTNATRAFRCSRATASIRPLPGRMRSR